MGVRDDQREGGRKGEGNIYSIGLTMVLVRVWLLKEGGTTLYRACRRVWGWCVVRSGKEVESQGKLATHAARQASWGRREQQES